MSLISALLTGVSVVGTLCQGLTNAFTKVAITSPDTLEEIQEADMTIGGAKFYLSNKDYDTGAVTKNLVPYLCNQTSSHLALSLPNIGNVGGIELLIPPMSSRQISGVVDGATPPDTKILIGPINVDDTNELGVTLADTAVKLCVNSIPLDGSAITLAGYTISADAEKGILRVQSIDSLIGALTFFRGTAQSGISAQITDVVYPEASNEELKIGVERTYKIDFSSLGFKKLDKLNSQLFFSITKGNKIRLERHLGKCYKIPEFYLQHLNQKRG